MGAYGDLITAVDAAIVAAGYVVAPSRPNPEDIDGRGAAKWVAVEMKTGTSEGADGTGISIDRHELVLSMIVLSAFSPHLAQASAQDLALKLRESIDTGSPLATASARVGSSSHTVDRSDDGATFIPRATFQIIQGVTLT